MLPGYPPALLGAGRALLAAAAFHARMGASGEIALLLIYNMKLIVDCYPSKDVVWGSHDNAFLSNLDCILTTKMQELSAMCCMPSAPDTALRCSTQLFLSSCHTGTAAEELGRAVGVAESLTNQSGRLAAGWKLLGDAWLAHSLIGASPSDCAPRQTSVPSALQACAVLPHVITRVSQLTSEMLLLCSKHTAALPNTRQSVEYTMTL